MCLERLKLITEFQRMLLRSSLTKKSMKSKSPASDLKNICMYSFIDQKIDPNLVLFSHMMATNQRGGQTCEATISF